MLSGHYDTTWVGRKSKSFKCDALACNIAVSFRCVHTLTDGHDRGLRALIFFTAAVFNTSTLSSKVVFLASIVKHVDSKETSSLEDKSLGLALKVESPMLYEGLKKSNP